MINILLRIYRTAGLKIEFIFLLSFLFFISVYDCQNRKQWWCISAQLALNAVWNIQALEAWSATLPDLGNYGKKTSKDSSAHPRRGFAPLWSQRARWRLPSPLSAPGRVIDQQLDRVVEALFPLFHGCLPWRAKPGLTEPKSLGSSPEQC